MRTEQLTFKEKFGLCHSTHLITSLWPELVHMATANCKSSLEAEALLNIQFFNIVDVLCGVDLSSLTRDQTHTPYIGSTTES